MYFTTHSPNVKCHLPILAIKPCMSSTGIFIDNLDASERLDNSDNNKLHYWRFNNEINSK